MNELEINADDSSDEEGIVENIQKYNLSAEYNQLMTNRPSYIQESDPEGYSFLMYALSVNQLYSPQVNACYYQKKAELGKTELTADDDKIKDWFSRVLNSAVSIVFDLAKQKTLTHQITIFFLNTFASKMIQEQIESWSANNLRFFLKQAKSTQVLSEIKNLLILVKEKMNEFVSNLKTEEINFEPAPFFNFDYFNLSIQVYIERFYRQKGFIRDNGCFAIRTAWPGFKSEEAIENIMVSDAINYNGRQNISHVKTAAKKEVFEALLEKELLRGQNSIIEKMEGKYRLKQNITLQLIQDSLISFLFDQRSMEIYLPYNLEKLKQELFKKIEDTFEHIFIQELKKKQKYLNINLNRALLNQQHTFISTNATDFHANLRLALRVQRRRIRQARDDEELETIAGESFQTAWKFGEQKHLALEIQEISSKGARNDQVSNLETYGRINSELIDLRVLINRDLKIKLNDGLIATWIREIVIKGEPARCLLFLGPDGGQIGFNNIPNNLKNRFLKFLINLSYLLLGCEVQRNPASLVIHQMALDLIEAGELTWTQALSDNANEKNFGGGAMPMTMGGYKKVDGKKATAHPVSCARALHDHYGLFAVKPWRYDGESSRETANNKELLKRENHLVKHWFSFKKLDDKPKEEKIAAIEEAISSRWYTGKK